MNKFTIITATYNCGEAILQTAQSIRAQNRSDIQWIVSDGGSDSETLKLISQSSDIISVLISEQDEGIYDAWNKAIPYINGVWVLFLGAGDTFFSATTLNDCESIISGIATTTLIIYGKLQLVSPENRTIKIIGQDWSLMKNRWQHGRMKLPVHPEVFHHSSLFQSLQFNKNFKIVGDSDFLIRAIKIAEPVFIDLIVTNMISGGISQAPKAYRKVLNEIALLNKSNSIYPPTFIWFLFKLRLLLKSFLSSLIADRVYSRIRSFLKL